MEGFKIKVECDRGEEYGVITQRDDETFSVSRHLGEAHVFENETDARRVMKTFLQMPGADWLSFRIEAT